MKKIFDHHIPFILVAFITAMAPHVFRLPAWILGWIACLWGYAFWGSLKKKPLLPKSLLAGLALTGFLGAIITYRGAFHNDTYIALLAVMSGLKMLEIYSHRDRMVALFLAYFVVITNLFYSDELVMTLYMMLSVFVTTVVMIHVHHPSGRLRKKARLAGVIMLQAIPLMIILFFLFPRVQGSFLGLAQKRGGSAGFSETMSPGSFSNLARNSETAFRVQFKDEIPKPDQQYWRGIVLQIFDGRTWRPSIQKRPSIQPIRGEDPVSYTITLEPYKNQWMFALEMPASKPPRYSFLTTEHTLWARRGINSRVVYRMSSYLSYHTGERFQKWEKLALQLPRHGNPEARALALKWQNTLPGSEEIINAALAFFREHDFVYTLNPPILGKNTVDDFLFRTRKGYCEHYASAFVFLMRAAGVPARVVGGYQGGELNPYGDYLIVHQSEAHAWAEVWLPQKGWTRVDPTAVVAPERLTLGMRGALSPEDLSGLVSMPDLGPLTEMFKSFRLGWDSINAYWTIWVMGYTSQDQTSLLEKFGIRTGERWKTFLKAGLLAAGLTLLFIAFLFFRMSRRVSRIKTDSVRKRYDRFCKKMAKIGIERQAGEGPVDYCRRIENTREDLAASAADITTLYVRLRYGTGAKDDDARRLGLLIRRFKPKAVKKADPKEREKGD